MNWRAAFPLCSAMIFRLASRSCSNSWGLLLSLKNSSAAATAFDLREI
ncbi:hypothetical protein [uncultured Ruegeria sp.]